MTTATVTDTARQQYETDGYLSPIDLFSAGEIDAYREQFDVAQRTLLDVLDAENELFVSKGQLVTSQVNETLASYRILALGGIAVILGILTDLAALGLAAYALIAAFMVHHFWTDEEPTRTVEMSMFMKNLSIAGGALILFALASLGEGLALDLTITDPVFDWTP